VRRPRSLQTALLGVAPLSLCCLACGPDDGPAPYDVSARVSDEVRTVVSVSFTTGAPVRGYVEYGETTALGSRTPLEPAATTSHSRLLLGLAADTQYYYRVVTDGGSATSPISRVRTGDLPLGLPELTLTGDGHDHFTLTTVLGLSKAIIVLDPQGRIVWYRTEDRELDFYRARLSADGTSILYNAGSVSGTPSEASELVRVSLDGSSVTSLSVPLLAHDFVEHPDGTLGAIVVEYRDFDGTMLRGDSIVEFGTDGTEHKIWSAWDCFDPSTTPGDEITLGWTFANALDYDAEEGAYYLGMRNFSSIAKINRRSGACEWVLGTFGRTLDFAPDSDRFLHQHQFHLLDDRILVFDNDGSAGDESRVLEYELDFAANTATQVWSYVSDPKVHSFVLGEPVRLEGGDTFIDWSAAGQLERVTPDGRSLWKLNSGAGYAFGFSTLAKSLYSPE
jgi:hypothetical protein